jgi:hypothetical protein
MNCMEIEFLVIPTFLFVNIDVYIYENSLKYLNL